MSEEPVGDILYNGIFIVFAAVTIASAFVVVTAANIVRAGFALIFTFGGVAALYVYLHADFIAATQLLVYVGGILVLLLFGVMLTHRITSVELHQGNARVIRSALIFAGLLYVLFTVYFNTEWMYRGEPETGGTVAKIGQAFMTTHLLPFEVASVLLLAALIGAVVVARREGGE
ncbi:MAG: NADH-quinone oxidoreductase subunit J [Candidatus Eiseniibacteriota bacterium]